MNEVDALRTRVRQLNYAVATTTCRKTVEVLRQMLRESEAKLRALESRPPAESGCGHRSQQHRVIL